jgi:hypothetical protein
MKMEDKELITFATDFREGILSGKSSALMCGAVSWPLASLLRVNGVKCDTVESDLGFINHFWIKMPDGRALDPTADQFNTMFDLDLPPVYLGEPLNIHGAI